MPADLFLALQDAENSRRHPILTALLYIFCPAAARWWLAGADPEIPFDPVWQALSDRTKGGTLKETLQSYDFGTWLDVAKQYIEQVEAYRRLHPGITAPERLPTFIGARTDVNIRHNKQHAIEKLGGVWENFFVYTRAWAFLIQDWERAVKLTGELDFAAARLALTLPGVRRPAYFPAWLWTEREKKKAGLVVTRIVIGALTSNLEQDQVRFSLLQRANPTDDKPWPVIPEVWALDRGTGQAAQFTAHLPDGLDSLVLRLSEIAQSEGAVLPPINALQYPLRCRGCGYKAQCFTRSETSSLAMKF